MRNKFYQNDIKVFSFINSDECKTFEDLKKYLINYHLPFLERWAFYFLGKRNSLSDKEISNLGEDNYISYGGFVKGELYHWNFFLNLKPSKIKDIYMYYHPHEPGDIEILYSIRSFDEEELNQSFLPEDQISLGWRYVQDAVRDDEKQEEYFQKGESAFDEDIPSDDFRWYDPFEGLGNWGQGDGY